MATQKINWNLSNNYAFKPVDSLSILNKKVQTTHSAWGDDSELDSPTTKFWLNYKLTPNDRFNNTPFYMLSGILSSSFNKIIFPSISTEQFLTQSVDSAVYYLDVYSSIKIPIEVSGAYDMDHLYNTHSVYSDSPNLVFQTTHSNTGYASFALLPKERVFSIAWGDISGSGAISASYLPFTYYTTPSKAVYHTYKSVLNQTGSLMTVGTGSVERFFAIHLDKQKLKNGILPNTIELPMMISASQIIFSDPNIFEADVITLTDNSASVEINQNVGHYSHIVSGTLSTKNVNDIYGTIYYDLGILLLDSDKLNTKLNLNVNLKKYPSPLENVVDHTLYHENNLNTVKLFNSIQACSYKNICSPDIYMDYDCLFSPLFFKCSVKENLVENPVYAVVRPYEFNYSNSPSWQETELMPSSDVKIKESEFSGLWFTSNAPSPLGGNLYSDTLFIGTSTTEIRVNKLDSNSGSIANNIDEIIPNKTHLYVNSTGSYYYEYEFLVTSVTNYSNYISMNVTSVTGSAFNSLGFIQIKFNTPESEISGIPKSCKSFTDLGYGCDELENSQQKYVYWYYPNKKLPKIVYAAHFIKNEIGVCNCEYLGNINEYKKYNRLPHLNHKSYSVKKQFLNNPVSYITTIGLYDDQYRLLAVGKLSKALKKDQFTTYMFKVNIKI